MRVLIAMPALNEQETIGSVIQSLPASIEGVERVSLLVVDDGSTDRTSAVAVEAGAEVIRHARNVGVGGAFQTAVRETLTRGYDVLVTIDADGQFNPADICRLLEPVAAREADFVSGSRFLSRRKPDGMPLVKYLGNKAVSRILEHFVGAGLSDVSCGFRAYSREALLHLNLFGKFTYTQETILDMAFKDLRLTEVPIEVRYFEGRQSRVAGSILRYAVNASKIIIRSARDFKPLRFFGLVGAAVFIVGAAAETWLGWYYLNTGAFSPFKAVGVAGLALNTFGLAIAGIGLLADMLDRMRMNQERLLYYHKRLLYSREAPESFSPSISGGETAVSNAECENGANSQRLRGARTT